MGNDGRVKLVDFGLARLWEGDADRTRTLALEGTVPYMSPEQASGLELGPPSDVFSFGTLAYELLTGHRPFDRTSAPATLNAIAHEPHAPLAAPVSSAIAGLIDRCLDKEPIARYRNGADLSLELRRIARLLPPTHTVSRGRPSSAASAAGSSPEVRFCVTKDGARIAYSTVGTGPPLVRALGWFTHLEMEWEWPAMRLLWERLAESTTVVRYDGRGMGLSDRWGGDFTEEARRLDLEAVVNAVSKGPVSVFGISEGGWTACSYALNHPERVASLVLYGAYARGGTASPTYDAELVEALLIMVRKGWGRDTPTFRRMFTNNYFLPNTDPGLIAHFNQLQRASADPESAARYMRSIWLRGDASREFSQIRTPALVLHCRDDQLVPFDEGRHLASLIPGARLVPLPTGTHYFPTEKEVTPALVSAIVEFTSRSR